MNERIYSGIPIIDGSLALDDEEELDDEYDEDIEDDEDDDYDEKMRVEALRRIALKERNKKKSKKKMKKEKKSKRNIEFEDRNDYKIAIIQLMTRLEFIKKKLAKLDPGKKKDAIKIAAYNIEMIEIKQLISDMEIKSGIHLDDLHIGSKPKRFVHKVKDGFKKMKKKVKKFCKKNKELVVGVLTLTIPVVCSVLLKFVLHI